MQHNPKIPIKELNQGKAEDKKVYKAIRYGYDWFQEGKTKMKIGYALGTTAQVWDKFEAKSVGVLEANQVLFKN